MAFDITEVAPRLVNSIISGEDVGVPYVHYQLQGKEAEVDRVENADIVVNIYPTTIPGEPVLLVFSAKLETKPELHRAFTRIVKLRVSRQAYEDQRLQVVHRPAGRHGVVDEVRLKLEHVLFSKALPICFVLLSTVKRNEVAFIYHSSLLTTIECLEEIQSTARSVLEGLEQ